MSTRASTTSTRSATKQSATGQRGARNRIPSGGAPAFGAHADVVALQRTAGNAAVNSRLRPPPPQPSPLDADAPAELQPLAHSALNSVGQPLDTGTRGQMESRFSRDFGQVRLHTDGAAASSARMLNANAYTVGQDIVFAAGAYEPQTPRGQLLLAHELAHVVQQERTSPVSPSPSPSSSSSSTGPGPGTQALTHTLEADARQAGVAAALGRPALLPRSTGGRLLLQRDEAGKASPTTVRRIEVFLAESVMAVFFDGDKPPFVFQVVGAPKLTPGQTYEWYYDKGEHFLKTGSQQAEVIRFRGKVDELSTFEQLVKKQVPNTIPAVVYKGGAASQQAGTQQQTKTDPNKTPADKDEKGSKDGDPVIPLVGDEGALKDNAALAGLYLDFLARYAGLNVARGQAAQGLTSDQVKNIVGSSVQAQTVTKYFTQGWKEYVATGNKDVSAFSVLEETLLTQWKNSNVTVLHNRLEISSDKEGLGLFLRNSPIKYYDANGQPIPGLGGGYRDPGFRVVAPGTTVSIPIPRGMDQVLAAIRQTAGDQTILVYKAAQGYVDNRDLLWPAVREGWDGWKAIEVELQKQMTILVVFLTGHLVAMALQRSGNPYGMLVGTAIDLILKGLGYLLKIAFIGELLVLAIRCGVELSLIQRPQAGQKLDSLSQRHLDSAIILMRQLIVQIVAAGLTAAILATARSTAITLGPKGGGGGGPVPALAGASGRSGGGSGAAGALGGGPFGGGLPPVAPNLRVEEGGGEAESGKREATPGSSSGKGSPEKSGAPEKGQTEKSEKSEKPESGSAMERRLLAEDRATRPPNDQTFFAWEAKQKGNFRGWLTSIRAHIRGLVQKGQTDPLPGLNDASLSENTHAFIKNRPALEKTWTGWAKRIAVELQSIQGQLREARGDQTRTNELLRRKSVLEQRLQEMNAFEQGSVGEKMPDLVEVFFQKKRIVVTDITQRPNEPLHNFKTQFYIEVLKSITGWNEVFGVDFKTPTEQQIIE